MTRTTPDATQRRAFRAREVTFIRPLVRAMSHIGLLLLGGHACANAPGYALLDLVNAADVVLLGRITKVSNPIIEYHSMKLSSATVEIEQCYKRLSGAFRQGSDSMQFLYLSGHAEEPEIETGKRYFVFLEQSEGGPHPVGGVMGLYAAGDEGVNTQLLVGEPATQSTAEFSHKLETIGSRIGCDEQR